MVAENRITGDVLVVGGGIAGCFAAVKASQQGAKVVLVDKGYVGKSGQTPYTTSIMDFKPDEGHTLDDGMRYLNKVGEYVNNPYWTERCIKESNAICEEMLSWGMKFRPQDDDDRFNFLWVPKSLTKPRGYEPEDLAHMLRDKVTKSEVKIFDSIMIAELLKQDRRVIGAVGIARDSGALYTFIAKTTILCVGPCGFKPAGYPPVAQLTCDGEAMAYRAGAEIGGKEFGDVRYTYIDNPSEAGRKKLPHEPGYKTLALRQQYPPRQLYNAEGEIINIRAFGTSEYPQSYLEQIGRAHV